MTSMDPSIQRSTSIRSSRTMKVFDANFTVQIALFAPLLLSLFFGGIVEALKTPSSLSFSSAKSTTSSSSGMSTSRPTVASMQFRAFPFCAKKGQFALSSSSSSNQDEQPPKQEEGGEEMIFFQRSFYRFRSSSQVEYPDAMVVEERLRFVKDDGGLVSHPDYPRSLILREGMGLEDGEIGNDFFTVHVPPSASSSNLESDLVMALFLAGNPKFAQTGRVLQLSCRQGLAGLLGCIGAAFVLTALGESKNADSTGTSAASTIADDFMLPSKDKQTSGTSSLPVDLERLLLTDPDLRFLDQAFETLKMSGISTSKITLDHWDWTKRTIPERRDRQQQKQSFGILGAPLGKEETSNSLDLAPTWSSSFSSSPLEYQTILASDIAASFPEVKELARTVANALAPSNLASKYQVNKIGANAGYGPVPHFLYTCPDDSRADDDVALQLKRILSQGYRMMVDTQYLKLEKLVFKAQSIPVSKFMKMQEQKEKAESQVLDDFELEVVQEKEFVFTGVTATHHPDYAGDGTGDYFFPGFD